MRQTDGNVSCSCGVWVTHLPHQLAKLSQLFAVILVSEMWNWIYNVYMFINKKVLIILEPYLRVSQILKVICKTSSSLLCLS